MIEFLPVADIAALPPFSTSERSAASAGGS
jgi:hypothetical protein